MVSAINWDLAVSFITKIIDTARSVLTVLFIKKATEKSLQNEMLKKHAEKQKRQLEIASRPRREWNDLLQRMRTSNK